MAGILAACQRAPDAVSVPALAAGRPVVGIDAVRGELRHLHATLETASADRSIARGWNRGGSIDWRYLALVFMADAATRAARLALDAATREAFLSEARWAVEGAIAFERSRGGLLAWSHLLLVLVRYQSESATTSHAGLVDFLAGLVGDAVADGEDEPYPALLAERSTLAVVPALAALATLGLAADARVRWEILARATAIDRSTGLLVPSWGTTRAGAAHAAHPSGSALMFALPELHLVAPSLAEEQWGLARKHLVRTFQHFVAVREYPDPIDLPPTEESGRILFGFGEAASAFGVAAAAAGGDLPALAALLRTARRVAPPRWEDDRLVLADVHPLWQAALLRAKVWDAAAFTVASHV